MFSLPVLSLSNCLSKSVYSVSIESFNLYVAVFIFSHNLKSKIEPAVTSVCGNT